MLTSFQYSLDILAQSLAFIEGYCTFLFQKKTELDPGPLPKFEMELFAKIGIITKGSTFYIDRGPGYASNKKLSKNLLLSLECLLLNFSKNSI